MTRPRRTGGGYRRRSAGDRRAGRCGDRHRGRRDQRPLNLADNAGLALSRRQILDGAWGPDWYGDDRTVDVHVRQLRKKLGDALPLSTVWGVGYRLG